MNDKIELKTALHKLCLQQIEQRINTIQDNLRSIEEARNNETKSSAGDKYETGRAIMQMEEEKSKTQLSQAVIVRQELSKIDLEKKYDRVETGSLVTTSNGVYYISVGIGKVKLDGSLYYCISINSPVGQQLRNRSAGDEVEFNKVKIKIEEVN